MSESIEITIDGADVRPETVDLADTIEVLRAIRSAVSDVNVTKPKTRKKAKQAKSTATKREVVVSLGAIRGGTLTIVLDAVPRARERYGRLIDAIASDDPSKLSPIARASADALSDKARLRQWKINLHNGNGHEASISPDMPLFASSHIRGRTSLVISLIRVGGEGKRTSTIRFPDGRTLTATVASEEVAKQLGARLYQSIEVKGEATWSSKDGALLAIKIDGIGDYAETSSDPVRAVEELSTLAQGFWDTIDPDVYVREARSN